MRHLVVPELTTVAEVDGRPVAAAFGLLDYNPRIKQINGRLFPFGFIRLLTRRKKITPDSVDQHQRVARVPAMGSGSGGPGPTGARCAEVGDSRRRSSPGSWKAIICPTSRSNAGGRS